METRSCATDGCKAPPFRVWETSPRQHCSEICEKGGAGISWKERRQRDGEAENPDAPPAFTAKERAERWRPLPEGHISLTALMEITDVSHGSLYLWMRAGKLVSHMEGKRRSFVWSEIKDLPVIVKALAQKEQRKKLDALRREAEAHVKKAPIVAPPDPELEERLRARARDAAKAHNAPSVVTEPAYVARDIVQPKPPEVNHISTHQRCSKCDRLVCVCVERLMAAPARKPMNIVAMGTVADDKSPILKEEQLFLLARASAKPLVVRARKCQEAGRDQAANELLWMALEALGVSN